MWNFTGQYLAHIPSYADSTHLESHPVHTCSSHNCYCISLRASWPLTVTQNYCVNNQQGNLKAQNKSKIVSVHAMKA
jgi:hypothetical protein